MHDTHRVLLTTSLRSGGRSGDAGEEVSGSLILGELSVPERTLRVIEQREVPRSPHRPGRNSARGVAPFAGGWAVANTSQIFIYDRRLREIRDVFSDPRFGDIHSLVARDGVLFVSATASDSVIGVDRQWRKVFVWWAGQEPELLRLMEQPTAPELVESHDFRGRGPHGNQFHINHVFFSPAGDMIVNLPYLDVEPGLSKFWNVTRRRFHLLQSSEVNPFVGRVHDGLILNGHHYFAWTEHGDFVKVSTDTGRIVTRVNCSVPLGTTTGSPLASKHGWLRGSLWLRDELFLVGQSRLTLFLADMRDGRRVGPLEVAGAHGDLSHAGLATYCIERLPKPS